MAFGLSKLREAFKSDPKKKGGDAFIGIDIGLSSIKIAQIHNKKGVPMLDTYGELQLGPYGNVEIGRTVSLQAGKLTEALVDILREASATGKRAALAISYGSSFATIISVPTKDEEKISSMIPIEARKYIPVSLNEVSVDWFPVSSRSDNSSTKVLLAAIHNEALKKYNTMILGAELRRVLTEIEVFSTIRSSVSQEDGVVAIVDMGAGSTKVYISKKGVIGKTHSVRMGGTEITNTIAHSLNIAFEEAEELKRQVGIQGSGNDTRVQKTITPIIERGLREVHKVIMRFSEDENANVEKVILTGGGALMKGVDVFAQDLFNQRVSVADPFSKVAYPAFLEDTLKEAGPIFAVSLGAALGALMLAE